MWRPYAPQPSAGATGADREGWDRTLAVAGALSVAALLGCALAGVLVARRRPAAAPAEAASPAPPPPPRETTTVWLRPTPVVTPESSPLPAVASEPPARPAGRHDRIYDAVYERELERIARKREKFLRREQGRNGNSPEGH
jgi:hypothetical protein